MNRTPRKPWRSGVIAVKGVEGVAQETVSGLLRALGYSSHPLAHLRIKAGWAKNPEWHILIGARFVILDLLNNNF